MVCVPRPNLKPVPGGMAAPAEAVRLVQPERGAAEAGCGAGPSISAAVSRRNGRGSFGAATPIASMAACCGLDPLSLVVEIMGFRGQKRPLSKNSY